MNSKYGRRADPHAAEADFEAADQVQLSMKHFALVELAVAVGVFENQNPVLALSLGHANRIGIGLGDPQPAAIVDRHARSAA